MLRRRPGRTGFEASVIGFGGGPFVRPTWEEGVKAVRRAIELGVNLFDTARSYGDSEAIRCTECQSCLERCPSELDIPNLLKKADSLLS